jgi:hypothetical protein
MPGSEARRWRIDGHDPIWMILAQATHPLYLCIPALPLAKPRFLVCGAVDNLVAASLALGEERHWRFLPEPT